MNIKEKLLNPANFIILIVIAMNFLTGCKKDDICSETTWYQDADGDGLGNPDISILDCDQPSGYVSNNDDDDDIPGPSVKRINAEIFSRFIGETYPLRIFLPAGYESKNLPVLYTLDGKWFFEDLINWQFEIGFEAIIVAIGDHGFNEEWDKRDRDFKPGFYYNGVTGGHINFYKFLTEEVVPYIDENYENNQDARSLIGYSSGGAFIMFSLLNEAPEAAIFHGFIAADPASFVGPTILNEMLDNMVFIAEAKDTKIHFGKSSDGFLGEIYYNMLVAEAYPWLDLDFGFFENEDHQSIPEHSFKQGLQFIYDL